MDTTRLGFWTFRIPGGCCLPLIERAVTLGERPRDTAAMYENAVGAAIACSSVPHNELWHDQPGTKDAIRPAFDTMPRIRMVDGANRGRIDVERCGEHRQGSVTRDTVIAGLTGTGDAA